MIQRTAALVVEKLSWLVPIVAVASLVFGAVAVFGNFTSGVPPGPEIAAISSIADNLDQVATQAELVGTNQVETVTSSVTTLAANTSTFIPAALFVAALAGIALFFRTTRKRFEERDYLENANSPPSLIQALTSRLRRAILALKRAAAIVGTAGLVAAA